MTCENGGIEGRGLFITCDKMIKVKKIKLYGWLVFVTKNGANTQKSKVFINKKVSLSIEYCS